MIRQIARAARWPAWLRRETYESGVTRSASRPVPEGMARAAAKAPAVTAAVDAFVTGPLATFRQAVEASALDLRPGIEPVPARK